MAARRSKSLKNPKMFDALVRRGMSQTRAARISNGMAKKKNAKRRSSSRKKR